ncbi:Rho guanyl nucleotide exchange factor [Cordyceps militaris]|uniref:Rho guanyl nucleotide exchange factor n=1 Tax=Cordyceps militaris TaxID=73501 RepID=A0A2H4SC15_CORMI|nr:Rho guanyl nucleotide exchange factor [Cordyceps militaris]
MSFRGDDQRRYGSIPPVQYPISAQYSAHQQHQPPPPPQQQQQQQDLGRRPSFNTGDDRNSSAYYSHHQAAAVDGNGPVFAHASAPAGADELFLNSPATTASSSTSPLAGFQHRFQDTVPQPHAAVATTYNPQTFVGNNGTTSSAFTRSQSTTSYYSHAAASTASVYGGASPPTSYTPQSYNPAAYAAQAANAPQRQATYHGYSSYDTPSTYGQSPAATYSPSFSQTAHSPGLSGYQYSTQSPTTSYTSSQIPAPTYDPSQYDPSQYDPSHYSSTSYQYPSNGVDQQMQYPAATAPYPTASHIPVGPAYVSNDQSSYNNQPVRPVSQSSQGGASPYVQPLGSPGLRRHPTNAPLPSRPGESTWNSSATDSSEQRITTDSILEEIENTFGETTISGRPRPAPIDGRTAEDQARMFRQFNSNPATPGFPDERRSSNQSLTNGIDDDEAAAGAIALQEANASMGEPHYSRGFAYADMPTMPTMPDENNLPAHPEEQDYSSDDSEFAGIDLAGLSGGYGYTGNLTYGSMEAPPPRTSSSQRPLPTPTTYLDNLPLGYQDAPPVKQVEIDYGDTGGLQLPTRRSFDSGPDRVSLNSHQSGGESPVQEEYQDLFYHPGLTNRPLPPPPGSSDSSSLLSTQNSLRQPQRPHSHSVDTDGRSLRPDGPESYYSGANQLLQPERSISLSSHSNAPAVQQPIRSKTDAAEDRRRQGHHRQASSFAALGPVDYGTSGAFDGITLPTGRKKKFAPAKLVPADFLRCAEPWALSNIETWIREMALGEADLKSKTVEDGLTALFTFKVPRMNVADAEVLSSSVLASMLHAGVLLHEEEWVKFGDGQISGVLWQLTGKGCYAPKLHEYDTPGRCYSMHCTRMVRKVDWDIFTEESKPTDAWHTFYDVSPADMESKPKKEVMRQNNLHEIVTGEENYVKQLDIFRTLYRDELRTRQPPIIHPDRRDKFLASVFGKVDSVLDINKGHLLAQLKYRQQEQGPWIVGFSDIFREWIRKAKKTYIEYASTFKTADYMVRREETRNLLFKKFLKDQQKHKSSLKLGWTHFLILPLQRLQRYPLLLKTVEQHMIGDSEEKTNLQKAIQEIEAVTQECDARVAETQKRVKMMELDRKLVLRPGFQSVLHLNHLGRALIHEGGLQRLSSKGMRWVETHALLFDHYFILAKVVHSKDGKEDDKYDVSREPIPMPLLFLESNNDEPIIKQKGITAPLGRTAPAGAAGQQLSKVTSNGSGRPGLEHTSTGSSGTILTQTQSTDVPEGKILYPFKVKHLGHEVFTLYASSLSHRTEWCSQIIEAKTLHAKALFSQNAEPFRLRVLADASFHYEASSPHARSVGVAVKGTPLDRAIQDLESVLGSAHGVPHMCRAQVNCAVGFSAFGKTLIAIGTDYGIFISDPSNPRGWSRSVRATRVTQIAVLEDFNVCLVIADKSLLSYPLDVVAPVSEFAPPASDNARRAPQRLAKDVTYFATARMKDRTLVFYKRREGLHTSFKVVEPLFHKATEKRSRIFGGRKSAAGSTDTFRDFDEFFFPVECYSLSIFQTYIAVATAKGVEMLTLDRKQPMSIPDLKAPAIANIASRVRDQKPLGMFRLNENEFILTYEDCAVYVDKHGEVSRTLIMEYTGKQKRARGATMYGQYLLLFNDDYVEVRNADNGRLRQIIAGRDVHVIDSGIRGPTGENAAQAQQLHGNNGQMATAGDTSKGTVKIAMAHPELPGRQIVLEMLLNDGHSET